MGCGLSSEESYNIPPLPNDSSLEQWLAWKENLQIIIADKLNTELPNRLGLKLQESIGYYGQEIINNFSIDNNEKHNYYVLLRKLDLFFHLNCIKRNQEEKIKDYVQRLMDFAIQMGSQRPAQAVKEHLIYDLKNIKFLQMIIRHVSMRNDIKDMKCLNIEEVTFLIDVYDNRETIEAKKNYLKEKLSNSVSQYNQNCCGLQHNRIQDCVAVGKRCFICNDLNHFARVCNKRYIMDCSYCGISHLEKNCDAFRLKCSRCNKNNHFHWKCLQTIRSQTERPRRIVIIRK